MNIFNIWHEQKEKINEKHALVFFHPREIWFCALGKNVGYEQNGKGGNFLRPVLVLKKFNQDLFWGIPLSTKRKDNKYYYNIDNCLGKPACAIMSQMKLFDRKRLHNKGGMLSKEDFGAIKKIISEIILSDDDF